MLKGLTISNYALIDELDVTFPGHLVIITGETGAGKSILLGALSLLMGARCDVSSLGDRQRNCVIEAEFETDARSTIVRRVISPNGRSRCFVDDEPVSVEQLKALSSSLLDIHNQNQQLLLQDKAFKMGVVDLYADDAEELESYRQTYRQLLAIEADIRKVDEDLEASRRDRDYIEFQHSQLAGAFLVDGELEELEAEQASLANAESIRESLTSVLHRLENENWSLDRSLKDSGSILERSSVWLPSLGPLAGRMDSARIELKDIVCELESACERVNALPERLQWLDDRIALIHGLLRKFGVSTVAELIEKRDSFGRSLCDTGALSERREDLLRQHREMEQQCSEASARLHDKRVEASIRLAEQIVGEVRQLMMEHAELSIEVRDTALRGASGTDEVEFLFSANGGEKLPLEKCASGGETSRLMLCIKSIMASRQGMPTMIFDEIDTGVSGGIADRMGDLIGRMGADMQVIAITHLPQIACKGDAHFLVRKDFADGIAHTSVIPIDGEARVMEVARMLSGARMSPEAVANARSLLSQN